MVTEKQLAANRRNALKGGVKTAEGKNRVRLNAVKHGLTAKEIVLRHENAEAFEELHDGLYAELQPQGPLEKYLVDNIAVELWKLRRATAVETSYIDREISFEEKAAKNSESPHPRPANEYYMRVFTEEMDELNERKILTNFNRYQTRSQRRLSHYLRELNINRNMRAIEVVQIAPDPDCNQDKTETPALIESGEFVECKDTEDEEYPI